MNRLRCSDPLERGAVRAARMSSSCGGYRSRVVAREPVAAPSADRTADDLGARIAHQADEEMYIVQGEQAQPEHLIGDEEVPQVAAGKPAACGTIAGVVERTRIGAKLGAFDVEPAVAREGGAVASHTGRRDAIEQVDPAQHSLDQILGESDAHEVARMVAWQLSVEDLQDAVHVGLRFTHGEAADAET